MFLFLISYRWGLETLKFAFIKGIGKSTKKNPMLKNMPLLWLHAFVEIVSPYSSIQLVQAGQLSA